MGGAHGKRKLSKDDLEFLKENTNFDEATIREWHKGFYQDCPNGKLSPQKFMEIYKVFFPSGNAESFCDHVFRTFDADNNGYIDFKEFLLAVNVTSAGTPEAKLKWAFKMYDIDGNGTIDQKEMVKIIQAIYDMLGSEVKKAKMEPPQERAKRIFAKMDTNGDGILTQEEFIQGCLEDDELRQILAANTMKQ